MGSASSPVDGNLNCRPVTLLSGLMGGVGGSSYTGLGPSIEFDLRDTGRGRSNGLSGLSGLAGGEGGGLNLGIDGSTQVTLGGSSYITASSFL